MFLIVKIEVSADNEDSIRIKETAILTLGKLFKETKDAKGKEIRLKIQKKED